MVIADATANSDFFIGFSPFDAIGDEKARKQNQREQSRSDYRTWDGLNYGGVCDAEVWTVAILARKKLKQNVGQDPIPRWATG
jgi:hypothetical protein